MKYILPLEKKKYLYWFENTSDGDKIKNNSITPVLNINEKLENGVIYVESPFLKDEYLELTTFDKESQEKWKEILKELASKIGAKYIKTTLRKEEENTKTNQKENGVKIEAGGQYKVVSADVSAENKNSLNQTQTEKFKSSLEFEFTLKGKAQSIEEVEEWIKEKKINLEDNYIYRTLLDNFKRDNLKTYKETIEVEKILSGITEVNHTLEAILNLKTPLFSANMNSNLHSYNKEEFKNYKSMRLKIEILFDE